MRCCSLPLPKCVSARVSALHVLAHACVCCSHCRLATLALQHWPSSSAPSRTFLFAPSPKTQIPSLSLCTTRCHTQRPPQSGSPSLPRQQWSLMVLARKWSRQSSSTPSLVCTVCCLALLSSYYLYFRNQWKLTDLCRVHRNVARPWLCNVLCDACDFKGVCTRRARSSAVEGHCCHQWCVHTEDQRSHWKDHKPCKRQ